ncbi:prenyltransferase [Ktedonosporobacter rubrisoli]|nr:prenyltransferase [Ktedonosporobacter rubrisoli]
MSQFKLLLQVTRARTLPVMAAPVILGSALAWQDGASFNWGLFLLALIGSLAAHLAANVTNDVYDFTKGTDQTALQMTTENETFVTGSRHLMQGTYSLKFYRGLALILFVIALLSGLALTIFRPWSLAFALIGFLLAFFYVAPPLRLAYIGRGLGELDIFLSFGLLPLLGAYYVQANTITLNALIAAIPIGLYTMTVLYFHHFLHWRADKAVGKTTPIVALGEDRARKLGAIFLLLIAVTIIITALLGIFPWYSALAALTVAPVFLVLQQARGDIKNYLRLMASNTLADWLAALIILLAILIRGFWHT